MGPLHNWVCAAGLIFFSEGILALADAIMQRFTIYY